MNKLRIFTDCGLIILLVTDCIINTDIVSVILVMWYFGYIRYRIYIEDMDFNFVKDAINPFMTKWNKIVISDISTIEDSEEVVVMGKSQRYRRNLLYDMDIADCYYQYTKSKLVKENPVLNNRQAIAITDCEYVACIFGDGKTCAFDLYIDSLKYVRDEIRVDKEKEINDLIKELTDKFNEYHKGNNTKEIIKPKTRLIIDNFTNIMKRKDVVVSKGYCIMISDIPLGNVLITDGIHTVSELYNMKQEETLDYIKAKLFPEMFKEEPTYTSMYEIHY